MRRAGVLAAAVLLAACASFGSREPVRYFILEAPPVEAAAAGAAGSVVVAPTTAAGFYDTQDIVYSRAPGTRAYYQYSHWTERPQRAVHAQLVSRLQSGDAAGRFVLATRVEEIYHDAAQTPGTVHIALTAELVDPTSRTVLARRRFSRSAPAASYDAPGAVGGMRQALGALLDDVVTWVHAQSPSGMPRD